MERVAFYIQNTETTGKSGRKEGYQDEHRV